MAAVTEIFRIAQVINEHIRQEVRSLLETKHLYQRVDLKLEALLEKELLGLDHQTTAAVGPELRRPLLEPWLSSTAQLAVDEELPPSIYVVVESAKLFCGNCERIEPFRGLFIADVLRPRFGLYSHIKHPNSDAAQTFALTMACQGCGSDVVPETFLIERRGDHLQLAGRAPIEKLPAVEGVPREHQKLLRSARIARNSGQVLAAIALLRCFIEQYAHSQAQSSEWGDKLMAAYHASLPEAFPSQFRTFVSLYSTLSSALHTANESAAIFDESVEKVVDHFSARKLYRVP